MPQTSKTGQLYELTYLVPTGYTETELNQIKKEVEALIKKHGGSTKSQIDWGKKPLAYKIKNGGKLIEEASYFHFEISMDAAKAQAFERDMYLATKVLRHLFVLADDETAVAPTVTTTQKEEAAE